MSNRRWQATLLLFASGLGLPGCVGPKGIESKIEAARSEIASAQNEVEALRSERAPRRWDREGLSLFWDPTSPSARPEGALISLRILELENALRKLQQELEKTKEKLNALESKDEGESDEGDASSREDAQDLEEIRRAIERLGGDAASLRSLVETEATLMQSVIPGEDQSDDESGMEETQSLDERLRVAEQKLEKKEAELKDLKNQQELFGVGFGIAPSVLVGGRTEVEGARIAGPMGNQRVEVTDEVDTELAILLETHYFPWTWKAVEAGTGPFLAIGIASDDDLLTGLGAGWMVGWKKGKDGNASFNIGLGFFIEPDVQVLASGFSEGKPPPSGETQVRFKEKDDVSGLILFSFTWSF